MMLNALARLQREVPAPHKDSARPRQSRSHPRTSQSIFGLTAKRVDILFEESARFVEAVHAYRTKGKAALQESMRDEKRKALKFALSVISSSESEQRLDEVFAAAGYRREDSAPYELCELMMLKEGTALAMKNMPLVPIMRAMTAYLGLGASTRSEEWLGDFLRRNARSLEEFIIPGELPEIFFQEPLDPGRISLATRLAGPQLVQAAFAGCPADAVSRLKAIAYSPLGGLALDAGISDARIKLSSEELADAQNAFLALYESLGGREAAEEEHSLAGESWSNSVDQGLVREVSDLVEELDAKLLRRVVAGLDPALIASLLQGMDPMAHDRMFSNVTSSKGRRILDALEKAVPLGPNELTRTAQIFAQKILAAVTPRQSPLGRPLPVSAEIRSLLSAILSRE